jgi:hypothetical protein
MYSLTPESDRLLTRTVTFRIPWCERVGRQTVYRNAIYEEWECS